MRFRHVVSAAVALLAAAGFCCAQSHYNSFEGGYEGWIPDAADFMPGPNWHIRPSTFLAYSGDWSLEFHMDNWNDQTKIWIEKPFEVAAGQAYNVSVRWRFASHDWGIANHFILLAAVIDRDPETINDFENIGNTGNGDVQDWVWLQKSYFKRIVPGGGIGTKRTIWVAIGVWGVWETPRTYYVDHLSVDISPDVPYQSLSIPGAKYAPDGAMARLGGKTASCGAQDMPGRMYVQEPGQTSGIAVETTGYPPLIGRNAAVNVTGRLDTIGGERIVRNAVISESAAGVPGEVTPVCVRHKDLGGGPFGLQPGVQSGVGLNNIGTLVRCSGAFTKIDESMFAIDDGFGTPVTCVVPAGVVLDPGWSYVVVTGISSCLEDAGSLRRLIRVRDQNDIRIVPNADPQDR